MERAYFWWKNSGAPKTNCNYATAYAYVDLLLSVGLFGGHFLPVLQITKFQVGWRVYPGGSLKGGEG